MKRIIVEFHFGGVTSTLWYICPEHINFEHEILEKCADARDFVIEWLDLPPKTHRRALIQIPENVVLVKVRRTSRGNIRIENIDVSTLSDMATLSYA